MVYEEELGGRVRELLTGAPGLTERKMFGGLSLLIDGAIAVGVYGDGLLVRVEPDDGGPAADRAGITTYAMGDQTMKGWLLVTAERCADDGELRRWVDRGVAHARSRPPKAARR